MPGWEYLAFGRRELSPLSIARIIPRVPHALLAYHRARRIYAKKGFPDTRAYLMKLERRFRPSCHQSTEEAMRIARRLLPLLRVSGRLVHENRLCMPWSVSLAAALVVLGLRAQVVIGKLRDARTVVYQFHAWVEIDHEPVYMDDVPRHYRILVRCPEWKGGGGPDRPETWTHVA